MQHEAGDLGPREAAALLAGLRKERDSLNHRAAALLLIMWALVLTSATGSLLLLDRFPHNDLSNLGWTLFLLANILTIAAWAGVGAGVQRAILSTFHIRRPGERAWRGPMVTVGTATLLLIGNLVLQGVVRAVQGLDGETSAFDDIHHNLGVAFGLGISGAMMASVGVLLGTYGFRRGPLVATGLLLMIVGHSTAFLWVPDLGAVGAVASVLVLPLGLLVLGHHFWRRG